MAGVRRFVFVSSIKVNGEFSTPEAPFTENSEVRPFDAYAISKHEAELGLSEIAAETGMEVVIVRPPLVYGPGVKGNFMLLINLLAKQIPLPLGLINCNRKSFVSLDNLIDFLGLCVFRAEAAGRVFLVSDQNDVSTAELLRGLGSAMAVKPRLFPVPRVLLQSAAILANKQSAYDKLCGSLVVDSSAASRLLGWVPPLSFDEGLRRAVIGFVG